MGRLHRTVLIYNPASGGGIEPSRVEAVRDALLRSSDTVTVRRTEAEGHASELAGEAAREGCELVALYGGDGTVNECVQGLAGSHATALLVLPGGTANVLVNELDLPADPVSVATMAQDLAVESVRLGAARFSGGDTRYFLLMCGAGLDAAIASRVAAPVKRRLGVFAYWMEGAAQVFQRLPSLRVDGCSNEAASSAESALVVVSKSRRYGGGLVLTPGASLLAPQFEVAQFPGASATRFGGYLLAVAASPTLRWPGIRRFQCDKIEVVAANGQDVPVQLDGEVAGHLPVTVTLSAMTVPLLLPPSYVAAQIPLPTRSTAYAGGVAA